MPRGRELFGRVSRRRDGSLRLPDRNAPRERALRSRGLFPNRVVSAESSNSTGTTMPHRGMRWHPLLSMTNAAIHRIWQEPYDSGL